MGCSESKMELAVIEPVEIKPKRSLITRRSALNPPFRRIMENFVLVWLLPDPPPNVENEKRKLRHLISWLKIFTNWHDCLTYIKNIRIEKVFLIVPYLDASLDSIRNLPQMEKIYAFHYPDDQSSYSFDTLCRQLRIDTHLCELDLLHIVASPVPSPDSTLSAEYKQQEASFLFLQLTREVFFRLKFDNNAKYEFVSFFRMHYADDDEQLHIIDEFEATYRPQKALMWLTRPCFIWRTLQRIVHTPEIDIHYKMGFFLKHVYGQMNVFQENHSTIKERNWIVYRGKTMSVDSFETSIKNNRGGLLCLASFVIAETDKQPAVDFLHQRLESRPQNVGVLLEVHVNSGVRSTRSPLASLDEVHSSETEGKDGILFSVYIVFRIESVEETIGMWLVKLVLITDNDPQLLRIASAVRSSDVYTNPLSYMGKLLMDKGDFEQTEQYFLAMLHDTCVLNQPHRLTRVHRGLATNYMSKGDYGKALEHYREALETSMSYLPPDHADLAPLYVEIGNTYSKLADYLSAVQNYEMAAGIVNHATQSMNEQLTIDLNSRLNDAKKLLNNKPC